MKRFIAVILSLSLLFCITGCHNETTESKTVTEKAVPIESADDLVGTWRVEQEWPENQITEANNLLGIKNFETTAKRVVYIQLNNDRTGCYIMDFELMMETFREGYYTLFYDIFCTAKNIFDNDEFLLFINDNFGYEMYKKFLDKNTANEYVDSEDFDSYKEFFKLAYDEMLKYEASPIEEKAAVGAMWGRMLDNIGSVYVYQNNKFVPHSATLYDWSFEDGTFKFAGSSCILEGNTQTFTLIGDAYNNTMWTRIEYKTN